jgi:hypothetical protein
MFERVNVGDSIRVSSHLIHPPRARPPEDHVAARIPLPDRIAHGAQVGVRQPRCRAAVLTRRRGAQRFAHRSLPAAAIRGCHLHGTDGWIPSGWVQNPPRPYHAWDAANEGVAERYVLNRMPCMVFFRCDIRSPQVEKPCFRIHRKPFRVPVPQTNP